MSDDLEMTDLRELRDALPRVDMDPGTARRIRERAVLTYTRPRWPGAARLFDLYQSVLEPVLVGGLSVGFLAFVVGRSLEVLTLAGARLR